MLRLGGLGGCSGGVGGVVHFYSAAPLFTPVASGTWFWCVASGMTDNAILGTDSVGISYEI